MASYKVDTVLNIRRISSYLKDRGNSVVVHWIPGHKGFVGNELADSLAKEAAKEMIDSQEEFYEGEADKKEIIRLMKGSIVDKWQRMYENSEHTEKLQEIIPNIENVRKHRGEERKFTKFIHQITTGQMSLNYLISKIDNTKTDKCETCNKKETVRHFIYDCKQFDTERNLLEKETEDILKEFGLGHIVDINFQVLTGYLVDVPRQANQRMRIALGKFITSTGRFKADRQ